MNADELLGRLDRVKRNGGGWLARCPAHEDRNPSLSITEGDAGRILLHCHAGCTVEEIVAALGLRVVDLFADTRTNPPGTRATPQRPRVNPHPHKDRAGAGGRR